MFFIGGIEVYVNSEADCHEIPERAHTYYPITKAYLIKDVIAAHDLYILSFLFVPSISDPGDAIFGDTNPHGLLILLKF